MTHKFEEGKEAILEAVIACLKKKIKTKSKLQLCAEFVRQFYGTVALEDLLLWTPENLCGAALHFWNTIETRKPFETKICIYNPDEARDGWQTSHTVIEVMTDDAPFLVDSLRMTVNRLGLSSHLVIHMGGIRLSRNEQNEIAEIYPKRGEIIPDMQIEAPIFMEVDRQTSQATLQILHENLTKVLIDNRAVVDDWKAMRERIHESILELDRTPVTLDSAEIDETKQFLKWIEDHHFTFLGVRDYELVQKGHETLLQPIMETGLGVLRASLVGQAAARNLSAMTPEAQELSLSPHILVMSKTNTRATVHRDAYTDYIGIKRFNAQGQVIGERRIIGLYTSAAYNTNPKHIPFLRHKVALIMQNSLLNPRSHAGKVLLNILETFPRDDLIQATEEELLEMSMGIFHMQERRRIRMFARMDVYRRFVSCLVYVPKERFNTELRHAMQDVLQASFHAQEITFTTYFSESVLARIHYIIRINPQDKVHYDFKAIEKKLIEVGRSWTDDLSYHLLETFDEEQANRLFNKYKSAFSTVYTSSFNPQIAVNDIAYIEALSETQPLGINFFQQENASSNCYKIKLYQKNTTLALSDVLPLLENLGLRAISERPYVLTFADHSEVWIIEFSLVYVHAHAFDLEKLETIFQDTFRSLWFGKAENDGFNQLVLAASLTWREVSMLRAYAKYFKQIGFIFSQDYIENALYKNAHIAKKIVKMFSLRFTPEVVEHREKEVHQIEQEIIADLEHVSNLDEDKIIRQYLHAIKATLRTNFYQFTDNQDHKPYISIKLDSKRIPSIPKPYPMFEIFVYAPSFEGVHLRCAKVARGGLRWSDRKEDFRTEILGLMKAQQVKNAVIVPSGAKGGFVAKSLPLQGSREEILNEGIRCYQQFIRGLLDITDNYQENLLVKPQHVICYDEDDPYLVVAADKGTATFSDIANAISQEYDFWLGDAFASGGSQGYDHKKMGITAKGAWESVKRHFYELNIDPGHTDFTVVGIGDMAGDVFGNGMLLSKHIKLVAAFNHQHIFIDPNPDVLASFKERERLFHLPRSTWEDYKPSLISTGGGVFSRSAKAIPVSKEMKHLFGIKQSLIEPNELIRVVLQAKVDLLWSAGIGTFVKAQKETHTDVGDKTNDSIRINANQLRARVVGEGGNLGFTQLARAEYALQGGLIYTDFIDNSAGVSCSDKEVNIKILLHHITKSGALSFQKRNELLTAMTSEVSNLVLRDNYLQTRAISILAKQAPGSVDLHVRYLNTIEQEGKLDRILDYIPDEKTLLERKQRGKGLTMPEIAVLLSQSKIHLKESLLASNVPEDPFLERYLLTAFPKPLQEHYAPEMSTHPLKREIIATRLSNILVNEVGFTFVYRMQDETGAPIASIMRAYMIARAVLNMESVWQDIELLDNKIDAKKQTELMIVCVRLLRRTTRWFLRRKRVHLDITETVKRYQAGVEQIKKAIPKVFGETLNLHYAEHFEEYKNAGLSQRLAHDLTSLRALFSSMDIIEIAHEHGLDVVKVAEVYFGIGEFLDLPWIRSQVIAHPAENHWEALSREALRDDLDWQQRQLTSGIISKALKKNAIMSCFHEWSNEHASLIKRWQHVLTNLRSSNTLNYTMFFVATRELLDLTQTTMQVAGEDEWQEE
jgi:glutamate dehydrogenase